MPVEVMSRIHNERVIGIVRSDSADAADSTARHLIDAGLGVVEVSLTTPGALDVISGLVAASDAVIGAGTVLDAASARLAVQAGARLLVSPVFAEDVITTGHRYGAAVIPGCATPTEMLAATQAGADAVKLFPATLWRPAELIAVRQALPQLEVVPTGGIDLDTASAWLESGAVAVGMGSALSGASAAEIKRFAARLAHRRHATGGATQPG